MSRRKGMGKGRGKGYKNILVAHDKRVHRDSGRGRKQPQQIKTGMLVKNRFTGKVGKVILKDKFAVKVYPIPKKSKIRGVFTNPKHWTSIRGEPLKVSKEWKYDSDGDAFPDGMDCSPTDPKKQDLKEMIAKSKKFIGKEAKKIKKVVGETEEKIKEKLEERKKRKAKEKAEAEQKKSKEIASFVKHPDIKKLERQNKRVDELEHQLVTEDDVVESDKIAIELDKEQSELRDIQEKVSNIKTGDLNESQLKLLAINYRGEGFDIFSRGNIYEQELLRRQRKKAEIKRLQFEIDLDEKRKFKNFKDDLRERAEERKRRGKEPSLGEILFPFS